MKTNNTTTQQHPDINTLSETLQNFTSLWRESFKIVLDCKNINNPELLEKDVALYRKFNDAYKLMAETIGEIAIRSTLNRCKE